MDANRALGLPDDVREYTAVRDILRDLGVVAQAQFAVAPAGDPYVAAAAAAATTVEDGAAATSPLLPITLLTNNPRKLELLHRLGVPIATRLQCLLPPVSPQAAAYLRSKAERMGHHIPESMRSFSPAPSPPAPSPSPSPLLTSQLPAAPR